jgi:hypothetical protein
MRINRIAVIFATAWLLGAQSIAAPEELHGLLDGVLQAHVDDEGYVNYKALSANVGPLDAYLKVLERTDPKSLSRDGRLAYWINAYNAFTLKLILNNYPLKSIRDIKKPWDQEVWVAGAKTYSLNAIEHEILRKDYTEPRIHFAIVCASIGCPNLWNHAFREVSVYDELDAAAKRFIRSPKHVNLVFEKSVFGGQKTVLNVSSIFKWFKDDFVTGDHASIADFILPHADKATAIAMRSSGKDIKVGYLDYDWNLNERH